jgi:outer membrane biosynthesis protein TonB
MSNRKKVALAIVGSVLLHILIILAVSGVDAVWPRSEIAQAAPSQEQLPELTMLDQPAPQQAQQHQYVRTEDLQKADQKPVDSMFESDKDTAAVAEQPAKGADPVPTQEGKKFPDMAFLNHDYSLDLQGNQYNRQPDQAEAEQPAATPTPTPTPEATPTPTPPKEDELAMMRPAPTPAPTPPPLNNRAQKQRTAPRTAYRQQSIMNEMRGNITNRGRSSMAALGTPWGRFQKAVSDAVGSRWYFYINERGGGSVMPDSVQVTFRVMPDGRVENAHVIGSPANQTLASCSLRAVCDAQIPPMPEELIPMVPPEGQTITYTFTLFLQ